MSLITILKKISFAAIGATAIALGIVGSVDAVTLSFDDIAGDEGAISNGYGGFNWENFSYINSADYWPGAGYKTGTVSGHKTAYNGWGNPATISISSGTFDFNSAYLTGVWNNGLTITVEGFLNGVSKYSTTIVVDTTAPTKLDFNFLGIDSLKFTSSGGVYADTLGWGTHFALDDFTFNTTEVDSICK
jgi:hypothetical protein